MKTHLNFPTTDLDASVAFYKTLLHAEPAKHYDDYALFINDDPGLELALDHAARGVTIGSAHYGIMVRDAQQVEDAVQRLESAGYDTDIERDETCCYANQTKVWATDPDGRRWEVYTVHEETEQRDDPDATCCSDAE